ncbi:LysE/ArgO family amino acid transporter [Helicobacter canis]|uniref:L-lysine exporter LysE n=1 Tax=Helicobacter canis TaxID=29419 RepID=A0A377J5Z7_9HELI|nr:LysE family transporter [Helicobacter canis]STO97917.1 l-lysine exporter LysE [Helicobacter canis]
MSAANVFMQGMLLGISLIVVIGPQNAFVIRQGLARSHILSVICVCLACDIVVMGLSVFGIGRAVNQGSVWFFVLGGCGIGFLLFYAFGSFRGAYRLLTSKNLQQSLESSHAATTQKRAIASTLALTLLNPNFYIDTFVIIGGVSATLTDPSAKGVFFLGLIGVSFVWYFGVGYGVRVFSSFFQSPRAWAALECFTGCIMCALCYGLGAVLYTEYKGLYA